MSEPIALFKVKFVVYYQLSAGRKSEAIELRKKMVDLVYHLILHMTDLKPARGMVSYETVSTKLNAYLNSFRN